MIKTYYSAADKKEMKTTYGIIWQILNELDLSLDLKDWNPQEELARYFGIVLGKNGDAHIMEAKADGTKQDLGDAPAEGSELQYLIDLIDA